MNKSLFSFITLLFSLQTVTSLLSQYRIQNKTCQPQQCEFSLLFEGHLKYPNSTIRKELNASLTQMSDSEVNLRIIDKKGLNYELPQEEPYLIDKRESKGLSIDSLKTDINSSIFQLNITNSKGDKVLSIEPSLIYSEYHMQMVISLDKNNRLFGLGERFDQLELKTNHNYTMWSFDSPMGDTLNTDQQTYGNQPLMFITNQLRTIQTLILFRTSSPLNVLIQHTNQDKQLIIDFVGGVIDMKIFSHPDIKQLMNTYRIFLGSHAVPALWQLGHHQCRWGYNNSSALEQVMNRYDTHDIPIDTFWTDIDYLDNYKVFTNSDKFNKKDIQSLMTKYDKKYIPILDPTISAKPYQSNGQQYSTLIEGLQSNVFLMDDTNDFPMMSKQWAGPVFVPDFLHPNCSNYWNHQLLSFKSNYLFDGLWIDMNEVSNFVNGNYNISSEIEKQNENKDHLLFQKEKEQLPYIPQNRMLSTKTLSIFLTHYGNISELYHHNVFNLHQQYQTYQYLSQNKTTLPFVLSRSNTLNSHKYSFHWTGDNKATYQSMADSLMEIFRSTLNGIQMVGSDICGFDGNTNPPLCARWYQLGSLYPFSRNHNAIYQIDQDPVALGNLTIIAAQKNLKLRYSLLRYYQMHLIKDNQMGGLVAPLFMHYNQASLLSSVQNISQYQFMIGNDLMATPFLKENTFSQQVYIPEDMCHFHTGHKYQAQQLILLDNYLNDYADLFIRKGAAIQVQNTKQVRSTKDLDNHVTLKVCLDNNNSAEGHLLMPASLYNEQSLITNCIEQDCIIHLKIQMDKEKSLTINIDIPNKKLFDSMLINDQMVQFKNIHLYNEISESAKEVCYTVMVEGHPWDQECNMVEYQQEGLISVTYAPYSFRKKKLLSHMMATLKCIRVCHDKFTNNERRNYCQSKCQSIMQ